MTQIAVIDYDMGNLHSACKGLQVAGAETVVTDQAEALWAADGVVLPGVGAFDPAMKQLCDRNLVDPIRAIIAGGKPFLGICLGLQVLFESSEEGVEPGLGIFKGTIKHFAPEPDLTIPHMGWNQLTVSNAQAPLWKQLQSGDWVYFVHSYYAVPTDPSVIAATVTHGSQQVTAAVAQANVMAVQFHPEKSSKAGLQLLANFVDVVKSQQLVGSPG